MRVQHLDRPALHNKITLVNSFHTLLGDLATLTRNVVRLGRDRLSAVLATPHLCDRTVGADVPAARLQPQRSESRLEHEGVGMDHALVRALAVRLSQ